MTPDALKVIRAITEGRTSAIKDPDGMLSRVRDLHCFDLSEVMEFAEQVWNQGVEVLAGTFFPPAEQTWLEVRGTFGRSSYFIDTLPSGEIDVFRFIEDEAFYVARYAGGKDCSLRGASHYVDDDEIGGTWVALATFFAIINTPRLVGRREHQPHKAAARAVRKRGSETGLLDLRPWTEIKLELTPRMATGEGPERLIGRKCLHFCRSHLRVQNGKLVVVRSHWRGDAALGISQADYKVKAPEVAR